MVPLKALVEINSLPGQSARAAVADGAAALTWQELEVRTRALVSTFSGCGHHRAVHLCENRRELIPLYGALSTLGVPLVGIDSTRTYEQMRYCAKIIGATCVLFSDRFRRQANWLHDDLCLEARAVGAALARHQGVESRIVHSTPERPFESVAFTSGTTGAPRAVRRTSSFDARRSTSLTTRFGFTARDVFLATLPLFHASVSGWARMFLTLGGTLVLTDVTDAERMHADAVRHGVTAMLATPHVLERFLEVAERKGRPASLRFVIVGGKSFPVEMKRRALRIFGGIVHEYYGTTETGLNAIASPEDLASCPASSGRAMAGSEIAIVDATGHRLRDGERGRVVIASDQMMDGYLGADSAGFVDLDGRSFFLTPDCGHVEAGRLYLDGALGVAMARELYAFDNALRAIPGVRDSMSGKARISDLPGRG
jgi:acyl-CoA synthetase (AMP-forming)/AMP-acid ligase II